MKAVQHRALLPHDNPGGATRVGRVRRVRRMGNLLVQTMHSRCQCASRPNAHPHSSPPSRSPCPHSRPHLHRHPCLSITLLLTPVLTLILTLTLTQATFHAADVRQEVAACAASEGRAVCCLRARRMWDQVSPPSLLSWMRHTYTLRAYVHALEHGRSGAAVKVM